MAGTIFPFRGARRRARGGAIQGLTAFVALAGGLLLLAPGNSSASTPDRFTVTATVSPASGGAVAPGATVTYTLQATSQRRLPAGATVIDELSGLLGDARVATPRAELAKRGLTLNARAKRLTWTVPAPGRRGGPGDQATASFRATVSTGAALGAKLTTAAFPQGGTCSAGQPCVTMLTVAGAPAAASTATARETAPFRAPSASGTTPPSPTTASPAAPDRTPATARSPAAITRALPDACASGTIFNVNGHPLGGAASPLVGNIYELNTATGQNTQIGRFFNGTAASSVGLNGLAVEPDLSAAYAVTQSGGGTIRTHLRNGTNSSQSAGSAAAPGVQMIMGGLDPANGIYYYAGYTGSGQGRTLGIWGYDPARTGSARVLGRLVNISFANTGFSTGDLAFDASGNMFIVAGTNNAGTVNTSQIRRVNGPLPTTSRPTPEMRSSTTLTTNEAGPVGTGFYNGIAFASDGTLYAQYATTGTATLVDLNPNNGTIIFTMPQDGVPDSGILTDLAGCSLPGTLTLRKDLPNGRAHPGDQFRMTITGGGITEGNTTTTAGNAPGVQNDEVGPLPGIPSTQYTISESLAPGSPSSLSNYTSSWSCRDTNPGFEDIVASGPGTSGTFSFPSPDMAVEGANVVCTFTNKPGPPGISVVKTASPDRYGVAGELITYTYRVTNTGNTILTNIALADSRLGTVTCPRTTLAAGEHMDCIALYSTTSTDVTTGNGDITNVAHVTGHPPTGPPVTDDDEATVTLTHGPDISVVKSASPDTFATPSQQITYTYRVTNTGNVRLTGITLADSRLGTVTCPRTTLAAGEHMDCTATTRTTSADLATGHITNVATVTGTAPGGTNVTDHDEATVTAVIAPRTTSISVTKIASPQTYHEGLQITYTYRVTNTGNVPLFDIVLTDSKLGRITCPRPGLGAGEHMDCTATHTTTAADVAAGHITNVATVTGTAPGGTEVTDDDEAAVIAEPAPGISVVKTARPSTFGAAGVLITYTYRVTNTGNVTLTGITLADSRLGTVTCPRTTLAASEHMDCTATHTTTAADVAAGHITNVARVTGQPPTGPPVTGDDQATVTVTPTPPPPTTAPPSPTPTGTFVPGVGLTGGGPLGGPPAATLGALALALIALAGAGRLAVRRLWRNGTVPRRE